MSDYAVRRVGREIWFYGVVGEPAIADLGVALTEAVQAGDGCSDHILLHLCSHGGAAYAGLAGNALLRRCEVPVHVLIEGTCQSSACSLAMGAVRRSMDKLAGLREHRATHTWNDLRHGEHKDIAAEVEHLYKMTILSILAATKLNRKQVEELVNKERMLNAKEALKLGLIDEIVG